MELTTNQFRHEQQIDAYYPFLTSTDTFLAALSDVLGGIEACRQ